jgi:hypothetical protein
LLPHIRQFSIFILRPPEHLAPFDDVCVFLKVVGKRLKLLAPALAVCLAFDIFLAF